MTATHVWLGEGRPLAGWLHAPDDGSARGGVVLCAPLAAELTVAHRTVRLLAERLCDLGFLVLRYDHAGTGDSAGTLSDPGLVAAWVGGVHAAAGLLRRAHVPGLTLVGMRMGAALAAHAAAGLEDVDGLVLWDPCVTGRAFLREQQALHRLSLGGEASTDGAAEVPGFAFPAPLAADLAALDLTQAPGPLAARVLVLTRRDREPPRRLVERLSAPHVDWEPVEGQGLLLDVPPPVSVVPVADVERIAVWVDAAVAGDRGPVHLPQLPSSATVEVAGTRRRVTETLGRWGPLGLYGITTTPAGAAAEPGPMVVFLNTSNEVHTGPGRLWVDLARQWAALGLRSLRVDLSGLGDSPTHPGQQTDIAYAPEALTDVADLLADPCLGAGGAVLVGLCSGAYTAIEAGIGAGGAVRGVCALNPPPPEFEPPEAAMGAPDPRRRALNARRQWLWRLHARLAHLELTSRLPTGVWWLAARLRLHASPAAGLALLVDQGVDTLLMCGSEDARPFLTRAAWDLRRLGHTGRFRLDVVDGMDHALLGRPQRQLAGERLTAHVLAHFGPGMDRRTAVQPAA